MPSSPAHLEATDLTAQVQVEEVVAAAVEQVTTLALILEDREPEDVAAAVAASAVRDNAAAMRVLQLSAVSAHAIYEAGREAGRAEACEEAHRATEAERRAEEEKRRAPALTVVRTALPPPCHRFHDPGRRRVPPRAHLPSPAQHVNV